MKYTSYGLLTYIITYLYIYIQMQIYVSVIIIYVIYIGCVCYLLAGIHIIYVIVDAGVRRPHAVAGHA